MLYHWVANPIAGLTDVDPALVLGDVPHGVHTANNELVARVQQTVLLTPTYLNIDLSFSF